MESIIILLFVIALAEIGRLSLSFWPVSRKQHFKNKLEGVGKMIWDLEFKLFKVREIREDMRREYDNSKSKLSILQEQIKNWPKDKDEGDRKRLEDDEVRLTKKIEDYERQLEGLDIECNGAAPSAQAPNGIQGISQQIDSLQELKGMLKEWIKNL